MLYLYTVLSSRFRNLASSDRRWLITRSTSIIDAKPRFDRKQHQCNFPELNWRSITLLDLLRCARSCGGQNDPDTKDDRICSVEWSQMYARNV